MRRFSSTEAFRARGRAVLLVRSAAPSAGHNKPLSKNANPFKASLWRFCLLARTRLFSLLYTAKERAAAAAAAEAERAAAQDNGGDADAKEPSAEPSKKTKKQKKRVCMCFRVVVGAVI